MKPSDKKYFWTITFSILVHGLALVGLLDQKIVATTLDEAIPSETSVRLIYSPPVEKPATKVVKKAEPKQQQKTAVKAKTKPIAKVGTKAKAEPEPEPEQISASDPLEPALLTPVPQTPTSQLVQDNKTPLPLSGQKHYMAVLLNHIEGHKFYPNAARKRGLEGSLQVSFHLLGENKIAKLAVEGRHKLLRKSAEKAVLSALPMPDIPDQLELPMQVAFLMTYKLR